MNILKTLLRIVIPEVTNLTNKKRNIPKIVGNIANGATMMAIISIPEELLDALILKNPIYALIGVIFVGALNVVPYVISALYTDSDEKEGVK